MYNLEITKNNFMKDYLSEFKKRKSQKNIAIITSSLVFAIGLNAFLFWTPTWSRLQTSVINYWTEKTDKDVQSDLYMVKQGTWSDMMELKSWNVMNKVSEIGFSLVWNPDSFTLSNIMPEDKDMEVSFTSNVNGVYMVIFKFNKAKDISKGTSLSKIIYSKKSLNDKSSLNIVESYFVSGWDKYELQSSWIEL